MRFLSRSEQLLSAVRRFSDLSACRLFFVLLGVVLGEEVVAKVTFEIAEYGVDVVGVILGVIEFDEEGRALDAVVGCGAAVERAGPRKRDLV